MVSTEPARRGRTVVLVVHGVGDPLPGATLRDFLSALRVHDPVGCRAEGPQEEVQLEDLYNEDPSNIRFVPMGVQRARVDGQEVVFAEVFWGAASRVTGTAFGLVEALFRLIFGMKALISAAGARTPRGDKPFLTKLAEIASECLTGPVFAANILLASSAALYFAVRTFVGDPVKVMPEPSALLAGTLLVLPFAALLVARLFPRPQRLDYRPLLSWVSALAIAWAITGLCTAACTWEDWGRLGVRGLALLFLLPAAVLLLLLLAEGLAVLTQRSTYPGQARVLALATQTLLWVTVVPALWVVPFRVAGPSFSCSLVAEIYRTSVPLDGLQWVAILAVLAIGWASSRLRLRRLRSVTEPSKAPTIRLIVGRAISVTLGVMSLFGSVAVLLLLSALVLGPETSFSKTVENWQSGMDWQSRMGDLPIQAAGLVGFALAFFSSPLRLALDVANDVATYIFWNSEPQRRVATRRGRGGTTNGPIRSIFWSALTYCWREYPFDHLVILAHSQGTVVAIDELAHSNFHDPVNPGPHDLTSDRLHALDVALITMGSPAHHLYQTYFPAAYPSWRDEQWDELLRRLNRWHNIYRIDDCVGTGMGPDLPARLPSFEEHALGLGGHTRYWTATDVLPLVKAFLVGRDQPSPSGRSQSPTAAGTKGLDDE